jgi:outer membrane immunogenic protein
MRTTIILGGVSLAAIATAAAAQPTYDWSGVYIGVNGGGAWQRGRVDGDDIIMNQVTNVPVPGRGVVVVPATTLDGPAGRETRSRGEYGGQLGFAWQTGAWVLGAEADLGSGGGRTTVAREALAPGTLLSPAGTVVLSRSVEARTVWSARVRAGYAFGSMQAYATGGVAGGRLRFLRLDTYTNPGGLAPPSCGPAPCIQITANPFADSYSGVSEHDQTGWTAGGGLDWAISRRFSLGLEYRHTDLGRHSFDPTLSVVSAANASFTTPGVVVPGDATGRVGFADSAPTRVRYTNDAVTARLNFRFGPGG